MRRLFAGATVHSVDLLKPVGRPFSEAHLSTAKLRKVLARKVLAPIYSVYEWKGMTIKESPSVVPGLLNTSVEQTIHDQFDLRVTGHKPVWV